MHERNNAPGSSVDKTTDSDPGKNPWAVLGLSDSAREEEIRAAYLAKVKEFPPDRFPGEFEQVRDAYETLKQPHQRIALKLFHADPQRSLTGLLDDHPDPRKFVGPGPWLAALKRGKEGTG